MLTSGDVMDLDLGRPAGREAGFRHPAVVVTAQRILAAQPTVIQVVPLTSTIRNFASEITIAPDDAHGLQHVFAEQCQHVRAVSTGRVEQVRGDIGPTVVGQSRKRADFASGSPGRIRRR
jgi:mRNA interferase MazF